MLPPLTQKLKSLLSKDKIDKARHIEMQLIDLIAEDCLQNSLLLLNELEADTELPITERLKCLYVIDEINHLKINSLKAKRLKVKLYNKQIGESIDAVVYPYCRRLYLAYMALMEQQMQSRSSELLGHDDSVFLLNRTLHAASMMLIWRYFDGQPATLHTWQQLHQLFKYAEISTLLHDRVVLYRHDGKGTDFASSYVAALMLSTLQHGNYDVNEILIASKILDVWMQGISLENGYRPDQFQFAVDLSKDKGAERLRRFDQNAEYRFWRTTFIAEKIAQFLDAVAHNTLDENSEIRHFGSLRVLIKLFKKLQQDWSVTHYKRQRRGSVRIKSESRMMVINGLQQINQQLLNHVHQQVSGELSYLDIKSRLVNTHTRNLLLGIDEWFVVDESVSGFGVDLGKNPSPWVDVGRLIGCKHADAAKQYLVAEIRSIKKQTNGHYRAGVRLISAECIPIKLQRVDHTEAQISKGYFLDTGDNEEWAKFACLWVPAKKGSSSSTPTLIIPSGEYKHSRAFKMDIGGESKYVVLGKATDMHSDWVRAKIASVN